MLQFQELGEAPGVPVILAQRILESILGAKQNLCPPLVSFAAENPAFHVLGLDDKNTKGRDQNVVDLSSASCGRQDYALNAAVNVFVEKHPHTQTRGLFANPAFENRAQAHASVSARRGP